MGEGSVWGSRVCVGEAAKENVEFLLHQNNACNSCGVHFLRKQMTSPGKAGGCSQTVLRAVLGTSGDFVWKRALFDSLTDRHQESQHLQIVSCHVCLWASFLLAVPDRGTDPYI